MKTIFIAVLVIMIFSSAKGQTWGEWFNQKNTQKKYLLQQIAALQVYIGYVQKGYEIGKDGLKLVGDIKDSDFNLHKGYFKSLVSVNPEIRKYSRVQATIDLQQKIIVLKEQTSKKLHASKLLTMQEQSYCDKVFERLLEDCSHTMDDLIATARAGRLSLKDDERLQRIDKIYEDMSDKHRFAVQFSNSALELVRNRSTGLKETERSLILNGIK